MMEFGIMEIVISGAAVLLISLYLYALRSYNYWEKRGVPGPKASVPFGNFGEIFLSQKAVHEKIQEFYEAYKNERFFGYFAGRTPFLVVKDPDLIKHVLIKDFSVFSDRGIKINEDIDPLSAHLFNIGGQRWKVLRHKLTPIFTTGKLKHMFDFIIECGESFESHLKEEVEKEEIIECREHAARFTTDVIGSCAFGIQTKALADEESVFRKAGRKIFQATFVTQMKRLMRQVTPRIFGLLRLSIVPPEVTHFFINSMKETIALREKENIVRNDLVDVLRNFPMDSAVDGFEWTDHLLTAQAYVFFAAGFETSSTTISFVLWELARNPEIQEKLRDEVLEFDKKSDGKITYENVNEMKYLDMVIKESLRKNPPVVMLTRQAMQDYVIPGTEIKLSAGQNVQIPAYSLHHDPEYFPEPEIFNPERFTNEAKQARHPMVFLPFGDGPKNCIGMRFAYYQVKVALIKVMKNFRVLPTAKTHNPYEVDKHAIVLAPVGGILLKFERLYAR